MTLRAGMYSGGFGKYETRLRGPMELSRSGAHVPGNIAEQYLGRAGIGRYAQLQAPSPLQLAHAGFGDLCDSAGRTVAGAFSATGGSSTDPGLLSQIGTAAHADAGSTTALGISSAAASFIGNLWGGQCAIQDARSSQDGHEGAQPSGQSADMTAQFQAAITAALHQSGTADAQQQQLALAQQQQALAAQQAQQRTLLIGGGIALGVLVLGGVGLAVALRK